MSPFLVQAIKTEVFETSKRFKTLSVRLAELSLQTIIPQMYFFIRTADFDIGLMD